MDLLTGAGIIVLFLMAAGALAYAIVGLAIGWWIAVFAVVAYAILNAVHDAVR